MPGVLWLFRAIGPVLTAQANGLGGRHKLESYGLIP